MQSAKLAWEEAREVKKEIEKIVKILGLLHIDPSRIFCYKTEGSKSKSYARIWSYPKIFQLALGIKPAYVIEVLSKFYNKLGESEKRRVLIHELLHIPKNFSGALVPHRSRHRRLQSEVNRLYKEYELAIRR